MSPEENNFSAADMPVSTNTVVLSRKSMGMAGLPRQGQTKQSSFAPGGTNAGNRPKMASKATDDMVWCPGCDSNFEIPAEFFGQLAECSECGLEFQIPSAPTIKKAAPKFSAPQQATEAATRKKTVASSIPSVPAPKKKMSGGFMVLIVVNVLLVLIMAAIIISKLKG